jgi:hypothetical protein
VVAALFVAVPSRVGAAPEDPAVEQAQELFQEGDLRYQASNYLESVALFEKAYAKAAEIEDDVQRATVMTALLYNLAQAHNRAFDVDGDTSHLRQAKDLVAKYLGAEITSEERNRAERLRDEVEAKLAETEAEARATEKSEPTPAPQEPPVVQQQPPPVQDTAPAKKPGRNGLVIGGIVLSSLSAIGLGLMAVGLVQGSKAEDEYYAGPDREARDDADRRGRAANNIALAGAVAASVLLGTGLLLIILGKRKRAGKTALAPAVGPGAAALTLRGRF